MYKDAIFYFLDGQVCKIVAKTIKASCNDN
jgi:hypothetical protein